MSDGDAGCVLQGRTAEEIARELDARHARLVSGRGEDDDDDDMMDEDEDNDEFDDEDNDLDDDEGGEDDDHDDDDDDMSDGYDDDDSNPSLEEGVAYQVSLLLPFKTQVILFHLHPSLELSR